MSFDAVKCTVALIGNEYEVVMTVRYLAENGSVLTQKPISAKVTKGTAADMRAALIAALRPLLDQACIDMVDEVGGKTAIVGTILTQVNAYLVTK